MSRTLVLGTAGHIDHGKSAIVTALTGVNPDRLKEEQVRGITIDLGFAHADIGGVAVAFVDVPGHERFVRNMLAGAGGIDAVLLVVAADESVMPQTREHFHICQLLGLDRGVVALAKADLADPDLRAVAADDVRELVAGSFLDGAPIVPVSVRSGEGLDALREAIAALAAPRSRQARDGVVRLPIDRAFTMKGFGAVVTGTLVSGAVAVGDELTLLPGDRRVRMRGLQVHGRADARVEAPSRLAVNLGGVDTGDVARGMTLATAGSLAVTTRVDARLQLLADAPPLKHGARVRVHHGTSEIAGRVSLAATRPSPGAGWVGAPPGEARVTVPPGGEAFVRLRLERPAALTRGDRLVLRAWSPAMTVAGAEVLDPEPPAGRLRRPAALDRFRTLDAADSATAVDLLLQESDGMGLEEAALVRRAGLGIAEATAAVRAGDRIAAGGRVFAAAAVAQLGAAVERTLAAFHAEHPHETGLPRETLRTRLAPRAAPELFDLVMQRLADARRLAGTDRVALAGHAPPASGDDRRVRDAIDERLRAAGLMPPDAGQLRAGLDAPASVVDRILNAMVREKALTRLGTLVFHVAALEALKAEIRAGRDAPGGGTVDVGTFKQRYGLSRKFAIPLLEWLDRERVTRRAGERRIVL